MAAPVDLRTKKAKSFSPQLFAGLLVMSPIVTTKNSKQKNVMWQQCRVCLAVAEYQICGGKHFLILAPNSRKIWWLKKVQYLQKNIIVVGLSCVEERPSGSSVICAIFYSHLISFQNHAKAKVISLQAPQYRQHALISDFLNLAHLSLQEEAALATNWIKDRPERLKIQNLALATKTGPAMSSLPKSLPKGFLTVLRGHFLPKIHFQCYMFLQGTLGRNFDIFAASGESTAWVLLWKTRSRPIGVRVCPVAQFNFFSTAVDPRVWTMVVFWKEILGRQPQLITPENEGGDETNCPSPPKFFDDPDVPFGPCGPPAPPGPPCSPGPPAQPPAWPPPPSPAGDRERVEPGSSLRERLPR